MPYRFQRFDFIPISLLIFVERSIRNFEVTDFFSVARMQNREIEDILFESSRPARVNSCFSKIVVSTRWICITSIKLIGSLKCMLTYTDDFQKTAQLLILCSCHSELSNQIFRITAKLLFWFK